MRYLTDGKRHLICEPYSIENLHRMADDLGIHRCWFHNTKIHANRSMAHYDIPKKRIAEITARCEMVSSRKIVEIIRKYQDET